MRFWLSGPMGDGRGTPGGGKAEERNTTFVALLAGACPVTSGVMRVAVARVKLITNRMA